MSFLLYGGMKLDDFVSTPGLFEEIQLGSSDRPGPFFLTDVDGVCLNWFKAFEEYTYRNFSPPPTESMPYPYGLTEWLDPNDHHRGLDFIMKFQSSLEAHNLEPFPDAVEFLPRIAERYTIIGVTASGYSPEIAVARKASLEKSFPGLFDRLFITEIRRSKKTVLEMFESTFYVDDALPHIEEAKEAGHHTFLIDRGNGLDWSGVWESLNDGLL